MARDYVISRLINNNIVFSLDDSGNEIILFGKAIGFGKKRGETVNPESVLRVFKAASSTERDFLINLVEDIDAVYIDIAGEIVAMYEDELDVKLTDMMTISLSDHLSNAVENKREGIDVPLDITQQISGIYPREFAIARRGLSLVYEKTGIMLHDDEAGYIVLHYINCQGKGYRGDGKYRLVFQKQMIEDIESFFGVEFDRNSLYFHRFLTHLSFLAARIHDNQVPEDSDDSVYEMLIARDSRLQGCVERNAQTIRDKFDVDINEEEKGYLALHISNLLKAIKREGAL